MKGLLGGGGGVEGFGEAVEKRVFDDFEKRNVGEEAETKFRCRAADGCNKLFKGLLFCLLTKLFMVYFDVFVRLTPSKIITKIITGKDFLLKHFRNKHSDLLEEAYTKAKNNKAFDNYHADPKKITVSFKKDNERGGERGERGEEEGEGPFSSHGGGPGGPGGGPGGPPFRGGHQYGGYGGRGGRGGYGGGYGRGGFHGDGGYGDGGFYPVFFFFFF